jgi:hypothetical protein
VERRGEDIGELTAVARCAMLLVPSIKDHDQAFDLLRLDRALEERLPYALKEELAVDHCHYPEAG